MCVYVYCTALSNSMEHSSSWVNNHSHSQEIPRLVWSPKAYYRIHKTPLLVSILSRMNSLHPIPQYFPEMHSNIILTFTLFFEYSFLFRFSNENIVCISPLSHACYMSCPFHPLWFDHPNNILCSVEAMKLLIVQSSPSSHQFLAPKSKYSPRHLLLRHPQSMLLR